MIAAITILFFFLPVFSLPLVLLALILESDNKRKLWYAILIGIFVAILLYYLIPDESKDLYRYYILMGKNYNAPFGEFLLSLTTKTEPISNIYFYLFSKTGNYNLITIFTTIISYGIILYILFSQQKTNRTSNLGFNIILFLSFSTIYLIDDITGIRFCIGRLLFTLAIYLDLYKKKRNILTSLLYLSSALVHTSCIILILLRLFHKMTKEKFNIVTLLLVAAVSLSPTILLSASANLSNIPFLTTLSDKAAEYLELNAGLYSMFILQIILAIIFTFILCWIRKKGKSNNGYINFVLLVLTFGLLMISKTSISTRFIRAGLTLSLPVIADGVSIATKKQKLILYPTLILASLASIAFQIRHLTYLISYGDLFGDGLFKNLIWLLFK